MSMIRYIKTDIKHLLLYLGGPEVKKLFLCSPQLSMNLSLLINLKMPFSYLLAEKWSAMLSKKEFAIFSSKIYMQDIFHAPLS